MNREGEDLASRADDRVAAGPPERLFTSILMAVVALVANSVNPSREEVRSNIERFGDPYFRAFLALCMRRVTLVQRPGTSSPSRPRV